jgi:hypothetical protein
MAALGMVSTVASAVGSVANLFGGGGSGSSADTSGMQNILNQAQQQYEANFEMTEKQAMIDNNNSTFTTIASGHQQEAAGASASARTVGEANAHLMA